MIARYSIDSRSAIQPMKAPMTALVRPPTTMASSSGSSNFSVRIEPV
jgi:hypothetical protein